MVSMVPTQIGEAVCRSIVTSADGVQLAVVSAGEPAAPAILFLHGFAQSSLSFVRQFNSDLSQRYHLVAFDHRGQGASEKPAAPAAYLGSQPWADDVASVIAAMGLRRPVLVGWSFGGYVAMDYVRHHGCGAITGINMVGSTGGLVASHIMELLASIGSGGEDPSISADIADNIRAAEATAASYATGQTAQERQLLFATELMMPAYVRRIMAAKDLRHYDLVDGLTLPLLFTTGTVDPLVTTEDMTRIGAALPHARLSSYEGAAHFPFVDDTARFNRELDAFVQQAGITV
ncbi:MAG: alpha/beta hydrolase [Sphingobium sp.]